MKATNPAIWLLSISTLMGCAIFFKMTRELTAERIRTAIAENRADSYRADRDQLLTSSRVFVIGVGRLTLVEAVREAKAGDCIVSDGPVRLGELADGQELSIPETVRFFIATSAYLHPLPTGERGFKFQRAKANLIEEKTHDGST